jgi:hypothetical protein
LAKADCVKSSGTKVVGDNTTGLLEDELHGRRPAPPRASPEGNMIQ